MPANSIAGKAGGQADWCIVGRRPPTEGVVFAALRGILPAAAADVAGCCLVGDVQIHTSSRKFLPSVSGTGCMQASPYWCTRAAHQFSWGICAPWCKKLPGPQLFRLHIPNFPPPQQHSNSPSSKSKAVGPPSKQLSRMGGGKLQHTLSNNRQT